MKLRAIAPILFTATTLLSACGGGSDGIVTAPVVPVGFGTSLSGLASKGPLKNAMVTAFAIGADGSVGSTKLAEKETDDTGAYTLDLGTYSGAVQLVVAVIPGRTLSKDEATGQDVSLPADFRLRANTTVPAHTGATSAIQSASITPFTELANQIALDSGGLNAANLASASKVVFDLIGVDPVATKPLDATVAPPANASDAEKRYALFNAAVSAMANSAPTTTDATTLACFTAAAADKGKKIKCATDQIAKSVTVTAGAGGGAATLVANHKLVGLGAALVMASTDEAINKTGHTVSADSADAKHLVAIEKDVVAGTIAPIKLVVTTEESSDIIKARQFFSRLRSNAAALASGPLETGLADGVKAFGDSVRGEALAVASDTSKVVHMAVIASDLWSHYKSGATSNVNSPPIFGFPGGCTVYQGDFPTRFGGDAGEALQPYVPTSVDATSAVKASWVGCSVNQGSTPSATNKLAIQYQRTVLFNMAATTAPATVPYLAMARKRYWDAPTGVRTNQNLIATLSGVIGYTLTNQVVTGAKIIGDLPAPVKPNGSLLAARYPVNVDGLLTQLPSGAVKATFASGSLGVVPVGASVASLTLNLSPGGVTEVVLPGADSSAAQVADAKLHIAASIKTAKGELTGMLVADRFTVDRFGNLQPGHAKFTGSIAAAGSSGTVATFFSGALEGTNGALPVVSFEGTLTLPNRPVLTLSLSVSQTAAAATATGTTTASAAYTLTGRYAQDAVTVQISGTNAATGNSLTLADSSGVSVSTAGNGTPINVLVSGRQTARIDQQRGRIVYGDGSFESLN